MPRCGAASATRFASLRRSRWTRTPSYDRQAKVTFNMGSFSMRSRQRGATFLGMVVIIAILGFALYAGIRLMPLYLEYMAIARALEQTAKEESGATSPQTLRNCARPPLDHRDHRQHPAQGHRDQEGRQRVHDARLVPGGGAVHLQRLAGRGLRQDRQGRRGHGYLMWCMQRLEDCTRMVARRARLRVP